MPIASNQVALLASFASQAYNASGPSLPSGWQLLAPASSGALSGFTYSNGYFEIPTVGPFGTLSIFVAYNSLADQIVISIRGTDVPADDIASYPALVGLIGDLTSVVAPLIDAVHSFASSQGADVYLTGHSLGGGLAEALANANPSAYAGGAFFGSPGSLDFNAGSLSSNFVHITRDFDGVGTLLENDHAAASITIQDDNFIGADYLDQYFAGHSDALYALQLSIIGASGVLPVFGAGSHLIHWLADDDTTSSFADTQGFLATFGGGGNDNFNASTGSNYVRFDGGLGSDIIVGTSFADFLSGSAGIDSLSGGGGDDTLFGGSNVDYLEGGDGDDMLVGGTNGDYYSVGIGQGSDTISDAGNAGALDTIRFYSGSTFGAIDFDWFSVDGADLLIQATDSGGVLVLDVRIENMGSSAGAVEIFNLYASDGSALTQSWDLVALWAELSAPTTPPPVVPPEVTPPPDAPGSDTIVLTEGSDSWTGSSADETVWGRGGNDGINAGGGENTIFGGAGNDTLQGGNDNDAIVADDDDTQDGNDVVFGHGGDDLIVGLDGDDVLAGGAGNDALFGGDGDDLLDGADSSASNDLGVDWLDGGSGLDVAILNFSGATMGQTLVASAMMSAEGHTSSNGTHVRNVEQIDFTGSAGDDVMIMDTPMEGVFVASGGFDRLIVDMSSVTSDVFAWPYNGVSGGGNIGWGTEFGSFNFEHNFAFTGVDSMTYLGSPQRDRVWGTIGDDYLFGGAGDDQLVSMGGTDFVDGGVGIDTFTFDFSATSTPEVFVAADAMSATGFTFSNGCHVQNGENYQLQSGSGDDVAVITQLQGYNAWMAGGGLDHLELDIAYVTQGVTFIGGDGDAPGWTARLYWGTLSNTIYDNELRMNSVESYEVTTGSGNDQLFGASLDDRFVANAGADVIYGRGGDDRLFGGSGDDNLNGEAGDDYLDGGAGADAMRGGGGNDVYIVADAGDSFIEAANEGVDTLISAFTQTLSMNFENLTLSGLAAINGTGNGSNNVLIGNGAANILIGDAGADTLDGGAGADTMSGGLDNDTYYADNAGDLVTESAGQGSDTVHSTLAAYTLTANVENLILDAGALNGTGNGLNNTLTGNSGVNTLSGGDGNDTLNGGLGVDTVSGGAGADIFIYALGDGNGAMDGGDGADTLNLSDGAAGAILNATWNGAALTLLAGNTLVSIETINANLGGGVDWLIYSSTDAVSVNLSTGAASGFASVAGIERVIGGSGNDTLTGDGADNRLDGSAGDDTLAGGGGIDTLIGGDGADVISGGLGNDSIQAGAGNDTINWALGENRDTIDGGADFDTFNATGSASADLGNVTWNGSSLTALMDNGLANIEAIDLDLGGGVDWLIYNASAAAIVNLATNSASGFASVSNIEKVIGGSGNDNLTGDGLDNRLDGLAGNDTLDGGAGSDAVLGGDGADVIYASAGNDALQGQNGADTFIWTAADGRDTFNGGADTDTVNLTGSAVADVADTNWNGSTITGLLNNALVDIETVNLDLGDGGAGGDWLRYNTSSGVSVDLGAGTATGFASITGVENLIGGTGADSLIGDGGVNKINGNNGDDIITGAGGNDNLTGGAGSDTFVYAAGCGNDTINDFDAWDVGGQDFLDVSAFGINAGNFAARVAIIDTGADTVIRIDNTYFITLKNVTGDGDNSISDTDFIFGP
jgi:Ca2+-binding RTX toxin-like protein